MRGSSRLHTGLARRRRTSGDILPEHASRPTLVKTYDTLPNTSSSVKQPDHGYRTFSVHGRSFLIEVEIHVIDAFECMREILDMLNRAKVFDLFDYIRAQRHSVTTCKCLHDANGHPVGSLLIQSSSAHAYGDEKKPLTRKPWRPKATEAQHVANVFQLIEQWSSGNPPQPSLPTLPNTSSGRTHPDLLACSF